MAMTAVRAPHTTREEHVESGGGGALCSAEGAACAGKGRAVGGRRPGRRGRRGDRPGQGATSRKNAVIARPVISALLPADRHAVP